MDATKLRAWWSARQGLDGSLAGQSPAHVLEQRGWARSVGGAGPYLGLFTRCGAGREAVDRAVANVEIHELPSARGCTYVVPASDFALALKVGEGFGTEAELKLARKLGVTDLEIDKLCQAVRKALSRGPLNPDELREATGTASRNLGEEGKKKGMTTTLPLAFGKLQAAGEIRRVPINGRIDQQRYKYALWRPNPLSGSQLTTEQAYTELARRYFQWTAPATLAEFQWFSGLGMKAAGQAWEPLKLESISDFEGRLMPPDQREDFEKFRAPKAPQFVLVSGLDAIILLRRNVKSLIAPEDLKQTVAGEKGLIEAGGITDLPHHAIFDRGRLVGVWEYDTETSSIAWMSFVGKSAAMTQAVKRMEEFVRDELGDARSFSLDSPKSRVSRIQALRAGSAR